VTADNHTICRRCGFANTPGDQFCGSCGAFLEWEGEPAAGAAGATGTAPAGGGVAGLGRDPDVPLVRGTGSPGAADGTGTAPTIPVTTVGPPAGAAAEGAAGAGGDGLIRCPACGIANAPTRTFCQSCGAKLADAGRVAPVSAEQIAAAVNAPPRPVTVQTTTVRSARSQPKEGGGVLKWVLALAVIGLLVGGGIVGIMYALRGNGTGTGATTAPSDAASGSPVASAGTASGAPTDAPPTAKPVALKATGATASSVVGNRDKFKPDKAIDGDPKTCWQEGAKDEKDQWIEVTFDPSTVTGVTIVNGYNASTALYKGNRRLKDVRISVDGGPAVRVRLDDTSDPQKIKLDPVKGATRLRITIATTYNSVKTSVLGTPFDDAALGEITVLGVPGS
jgi:hypothetical protein